MFFPKDSYFKSSEIRSSQHSRFNHQQTRAKLTGLKIQLIQDVFRLNKINRIQHGMEGNYPTHGVQEPIHQIL